MHVDSFHSAYEPKDCQVLRSPCSLPLPQLAQKPPKCLSKSPHSPSPHLLSPDPSFLSTVPSFPAEEIFGTVSFLHPCYPLKISIPLRSLAQEHKGQPGAAKELWSTPVPESPSSLLHQFSELCMPESAGTEREQRCIPSPHPSTPLDVPSNTAVGSRP